MKAIEKWLKKNDLEFRHVTLTSGKVGIMVSTDYAGMYPTKKSGDQIRLIESKIKRFKKLKCEPRGHFSAVLITEI